MIDRKIVDSIKIWLEMSVAPELEIYRFNRCYTRSASFRILDDKNQSYLVETKVFVTKEKEEEK